FSQGPEFKNKALNFEVFVNNKKIPNNYVTVLNSKAIKISEISGYALNNVMIRFNFSYDEMLQRIIDNYKYKTIDVNEDRYHDDSIADIKSPFDVLTSNKQAKTLGNLLIIQLINSGKNILDCNVDNLPIDVNLNTDIIENSYIRKNINLDMNRTNLIKTINKISDYVNEILDVNKNNENLLLNSNNPSFYVLNGKNLISEGYKEFIAKDREFLKTVDLKPVFDKYGMNENYSISMDIKSRNIGNRNTIQIYCQNGSGSYHDIGYNYAYNVSTNYQRRKVENITPKIGYTSEKNSYLSFFVIYGTGNFPYVKNIKVEIGEKSTDFSYSPEDKVHSQYPYSKIDEYNKYFENKESIKDVHIKNNDIYLDFKVDESLLERNKKYTFSFYAR